MESQKEENKNDKLEYKENALEGKLTNNRREWCGKDINDVNVLCIF